jgi:hypothetical protein
MIPTAGGRSPIFGVVSINCVLERLSVTRRELFKRRIAPVLFGLVIALMARKSCHGDSRTHATFELNYGAAEPIVQVVDADLWMNDEQVANFHRAALGEHIGTSKFEGAFPATDGELRFDIQLKSGVHRVFSHHVHADENAVVTVNLEHDLQP